jgi:hypothetical protein
VEICSNLLWQLSWIFYVFDVTLKVPKFESFELANLRTSHITPISTHIISSSWRCSHRAIVQGASPLLQGVTKVFAVFSETFSETCSEAL